jgi:hypothetical protein
MKRSPLSRTALVNSSPSGSNREVQMLLLRRRTRKNTSSMSLLLRVSPVQHRELMCLNCRIDPVPRDMSKNSLIPSCLTLVSAGPRQCLLCMNLSCSSLSCRRSACAYFASCTPVFCSLKKGLSFIVMTIRTTNEKKAWTPS